MDKSNVTQLHPKDKNQKDTDLRNLNPSFNPRKLNPEFRTDQKDPLKFHPNEVARFAKDILRDLFDQF